MKKFILFFVLNIYMLQAAAISTSKPEYNSGEPIKVHISEMIGLNQDWVGIYLKDLSNDWENVISWAWTQDIENGDVTLSGVESGLYQARAFYNNSFKTEAVADFKVKEVKHNVTLNASKNEYESGEEIIIVFSGMAGNKQDWIGIYPKNSNNDWNNVLSWKWTDGKIDGNIKLEGVVSGEYEARAFLNNSFNLETKISFSVKAIELDPTIYEDADDGINPLWEKVRGDYEPYSIDGTLVLTPYWVTSTKNTSEFSLPIDNKNQRVLEMDIKGLPDHKIATVSRKGFMPHFSIGVHVKTTKGRRAMMWDSFFNHGNLNPFKVSYGNSVWLYFPSPVEHVRGWYAPATQIDHFKVDIDNALHLLEPDNNIISIDSLFVTGGFLDNITLSSK